MNLSYSKIDELFNPLVKRPIKRWILLLPGAGCSWAKKTGGCTMCGFQGATDRYTRGKLLPSFFFMILTKLAWLKVRNLFPDELWIYNGGSFLNDFEIPLQAQTKILKWVSRKPIKRVLIESRPEFIDVHKLTHLKKIVGSGKNLMIGIGLECQDDDLRIRKIRKGFSKSDYERAVAIAKQAQVEILTYVLLKPIGINEQDAIKETCSTIKYAFSKGSDVVALESAFIQPNTFMEQLYKEGRYKPPWLWSVLEVLTQSKNYGPIFLGNFEDEPPPIAIPCNCDNCNRQMLSQLEEYRKTNNIESLLSISCDCKNTWEKELFIKENN